jgi:hypothetical protein
MDDRIRSLYQYLKDLNKDGYSVKEFTRAYGSESKTELFNHKPLVNTNKYFRFFFRGRNHTFTKAVYFDDNETGEGTEFGSLLYEIFVHTQIESFILKSPIYREFFARHLDYGTLKLNADSTNVTEGKELLRLCTYSSTQHLDGYYPLANIFTKLTTAETIKVIFNIFFAIHTMNINIGLIHQDLHFRNIMINYSLVGRTKDLTFEICGKSITFKQLHQIKIIDFGMSCLYKDKEFYNPHLDEFFIHEFGSYNTKDKNLQNNLQNNLQSQNSQVHKSHEDQVSKKDIFTTFNVLQEYVIKLGRLSDNYFPGNTLKIELIEKICKIIVPNEKLREVMIKSIHRPRDSYFWSKYCNFDDKGKELPDCSNTFYSDEDINNIQDIIKLFVQDEELKMYLVL